MDYLKVALSHAHLDVHAWLPRSPRYPFTPYVSVKDSRKTYHQGSGVGGLDLPPELRNGDKYTVIYYDQVILYCVDRHINRLTLTMAR